MHVDYFSDDTDNSTVESCLYKGNSSTPKLFRLMVCMGKLEMTHNARIVVAHVSGKRMIKEGTGGLSRGAAERRRVNALIHSLKWGPIGLSSKIEIEDSILLDGRLS
jgi:hypothetical protein